MFSNFFKPKWQHSKAEVRLSAIESFSSTNSEELTILEKLAAEDSDATVRCAAIRKLLDPHKVSLIIQNEGDTNVREAAHQHLAQLLSGEVKGGPSQEQRLSEVKTQQNRTVLEHLLEHGEEDIKYAALNQVEDEALLEEIAIHNPQAKVRAIAAERVEHPDRLHRISRHSRGRDKRVYKIARDKLAGMRAHIYELQEHRKHCDDICDDLEALARTEFSALFAPKLRGLKLQWDKLSLPPEAEYSERFQAAYKQCEAVLDEHDAAMADLEAQSLAQRQIDGCCQSLVSKVDQLSHLSDVSKVEIDAADALLEQQQHHWDHASKEINVAKADAMRYQKAHRTLSEYHEQASFLLSKIDFITQSLEKAKQFTIPDDTDKMRHLQKEVKSIVKKIHWPEKFVTPDPLKLASQTLTILADKEKALNHWQKEQLPELKSTLEVLSQAIDAGKLKQAETLFHKTQQLFNQLPDHHTKHHHQHFGHLKARIQELRDWRGFAGVQHKEDLCERMEALIDQAIDPEEKAVLIKQLQEEWKHLGPTGHEKSEELWQRFRAAGDKAYEPCRAFHHQQSEERKRNFEERQSICDQLEQHIETTDWSSVDWHKEEKILSTAKSEWRNYSPVDRKAGKAVQERFDGLLAQLKEKLQTEYDRNIKAKELLVHRTETLIKDEELAHAIEEAKHIQAQWKEIGITPDKANQKLWKNFRAACDAIFARRDEERQAHKQARKENKHHAEVLCERVEALAKCPDNELSKSHDEYEKNVEEFNEIHDLPRGVEKAIQKRFDLACKRYNAQLSGIGARAQVAQIKEIIRKTNICETLELAILSNNSKEPTLSQWEGDVTLPGEIEKELSTRFTKAQNDFKNSDNSRLLSTQEVTLKAQELLSIQAEILADIESPAEAKKMRMEYQLNLLNQGITQSAEVDKSAEAKALELVQNWSKQTATISGEHNELKQRFEDAISKALTQQSI